MGFDENGLALVKVGRKWGYLGRDGKLAINAQFEIAESFSVDGIARAYVGGNVGYIDKSGRFVWNPRIENRVDE